MAFPFNVWELCFWGKLMCLLMWDMNRFDMPAPVITPELKQDLQLLKVYYLCFRLSFSSFIIYFITNAVHSKPINI